MILICVEITDNTEMSILLNSSKQPQAPHWARPENILPTACTTQTSNHAMHYYCIDTGIY